MTWADLPDGTPFGLACLPYGVASRPGGRRWIAVAIGGQVLDVAPVAARLAPALAPPLAHPVLNPLLAAGRRVWAELRERLTEWLSEPRFADAVRPHLVPAAEVRLHLPFKVGDYADFYASERHAANLGRILRPGTPPLPPNWRHLPLGYHGRAGTVVVSGTPVVRPRGQYREPGADAPCFGPSRRLDFEAEVGFVVGAASRLGEPVPVSAFADHVFGVCLVDDWSARDIQAWEYTPLGPFLGKSFATSVSPWVVPLAALAAARVPPPPRDPEPLPYLRETEDWGLDLTLEVRLNGHLISRPPFAGMYWTAAQQLAHLTVNGASVRPGDLYASGTVSGAGRGEYGSLIELTWNGAEPLALPGGGSRTFLEDGDEVVITATAPGVDGGRIGLGEVRGRIAPAR